MRLISKAAVLMLAAVVSACQTTPILPKGEQGQIVDVTVTRANEGMGTANLVEDIRVKTQNEAYRVAETGPAKTLQVHVVGFQGPSAGLALFISTASSSIVADITLTDVETGKSFESKRVFAQNFRTGGLIGALSAALTDPVNDERSLVDQLSVAIVRQVYGSEFLKSVENRKASKETTANYPVSYESERQRIKCRDIITSNELERENAELDNQEPLLRTVPAYCAQYEDKTS